MFCLALKVSWLWQGLTCQDLIRPYQCSTTVKVNHLEAQRLLGNLFTANPGCLAYLIVRLLSSHRAPVAANTLSGKQSTYHAVYLTCCTAVLHNNCLICLCVSMAESPLCSSWPAAPMYSNNPSPHPGLQELCLAASHYQEPVLGKPLTGRLSYPGLCGGASG